MQHTRTRRISGLGAPPRERETRSAIFDGRGAEEWTVLRRRGRLVSSSPSRMVPRPTRRPRSISRRRQIDNVVGIA